MLTGYGLLIQTSNQPAGIALSWESTFDNKPVGERPDIHEIYALLILVQKAFPNLFITSNRAEQFNSVHDREINYKGYRSPDNANRHLKSWILFKYHSKGVEQFLLRQKMIFPMSIIQNSFHLSLKKVIFK
ncbi:hypothetical protein LCGC14_1987260 [marine sediment metagenome]|uniref:Uncharacterized protein n=1 Tax=marine sediment metagenome TaxID=412755 RepID=A0A0F9F705_9ZZZZ